MTTDIHGLDRYIGRYVSFSEGADGMAGWVVDVVDKIEYRPHPTRAVVLDYGYAFSVSDTTEIVVTAEPSQGDPKPEWVRNPIEAMHEAMHRGSDCLDGTACAFIGHAYHALRAMRLWRMRQDDAYWKHHWVDKARSYAADPLSVGEIYRDARDEGAPPHILDAIAAITNGATA